MKKENYLFRIWIVKCLLAMFWVSPVQANTELVETTRYILKASGRHCAFNLYVNDIELFSYHDGFSVSAGTGIGDLLKPKDNQIKLEVWDPAEKEGYWRDDAKCEVYIRGYDPVKKFKAETVTDISFYPTKTPDLSKPELLFDNVQSIANQLGKSSFSPEITYSSDSQIYVITRSFDVRDDYIEWPWTQSQKLSQKLLEEQSVELHKAYQELWNAFNSKNISSIRTLYKEMAFESAMVNDSTESSYFDSIGFQNFFEDETFRDFAFIPLNLENRKPTFSLDNSVVHLEPSPILFCHKDNVKIEDCFKINPKFRFDGKKFVITR